MVCVRYFLVFFFKQKTAYEMRISDWISDVCSSDLRHRQCRNNGFHLFFSFGVTFRAVTDFFECSFRAFPALDLDPLALFEVFVMLEEMLNTEIGRASCRERVCQYV